MTTTRALRWLHAPAVIALLFFSIGWVQAQSSQSVLEDTNILRFDQAEFLLTQNSEFPDEASSWQQAPLPDNWNVSHPGKSGYGWYRFRFSVVDQPQTLQAVYFARASMNATVFLNGALIDNSGGLFESGVRNWNRPFLIRFLPRHLQPGNNELLIRVEADADDMGGLSIVEIGRASTLSPDYEQRRFIQLFLPQISGVLIAFACIGTFGFWLLLRDPMYGYFTVAAGVYFVRQIEYWVNDVSVPESWVQVGVAALVSWFVIFLTLFSIRLLNLKWLRIEKILLIFAGCVGLMSLGFGAAPWASQAALVLHVSALVLGLMTLAVLIPELKRVPYIESLPLAAAGVISLLLGVHDVAQRMGLLLTSTPRLSHLGSPLLILTISTILFSRYVKNIILLGELNQNLEKKAEQQSIVLIETLKEQHKLQRRQAVSQERELILREMHDGVGNYLTVALRAGAKAIPDMPLLNGALKDCMLDLRLMIDSLGESDTGVDSVATVLGNLRYRIEPALRFEGIELVWKVQDVEICTPLTPRKVLNLSRIFQEAFTNAIKHANASQIVVQSEMVVRANFRWAVITLSDNGHWRIPSGPTGRGLENMRDRAVQLNGELRITQSSTGSRVELALPEDCGKLPRVPTEAADFYEI